MLTPPFFFVALLALTLGGSQSPAPTKSDQADDRALVVATAYPGADAETVAANVAGPLEIIIYGVEGQVRLESKSSYGKYTAHLYFQPETDLKVAAKLVEKRVALASHLLPGAVQVSGVTVKVGKADADRRRVAIAVVDRHRHSRGWKALQRAAGSVVKHLVTEGAIAKPEVFPQDQKQLSIKIDGDKLERLRLSPLEVVKAVEAAGKVTRLDRLKKVKVRDKASLGEIATFKWILAPGVIYRINCHPAIRIEGVPPDRKSVAGVAASCVDDPGRVEASRPR